MSVFKPKYISFDCYGTLIYFEMAPMAQKLFADRITEAQMPQFVKDFSAYRLDEVLGAWKPYQEVIRNAVTRLCKNGALSTVMKTVLPFITPYPPGDRTLTL